MKRFQKIISVKSKKKIIGIIGASLVFVPAVYASGSESTGHSAAMTFLWIAVILVMAKTSSLGEKLGQPSVLGELMIGVIMGNLALLGLNFFELIKQDSNITFLSELGVVVLLFQIGLETNINKMKKVGLSAFLVACVGVVAPFVIVDLFVRMNALAGTHKQCLSVFRRRFDSYFSWYYRPSISGS